VVNFSVAVVAGGKSSRMGRDKAFVPLQGKPLIEHVLERTRPLPAAHIFLIANRPADYAYLGLPVYPDVLPEKGALGGIYSALTHSPTDYCLVVACDMPFLNTALLQRLISLCDESPQEMPDAIVPVFGDRPQGLHAVYRRTCLEPILEDLKRDRLKVIGFYERVKVRYLYPEEYRDLDPQGRSFRNINTPDELRNAESES
jgi:molybdopterin-guanine dinucleotide biosynthesis protein A